MHGWMPAHGRLSAQLPGHLGPQPHPALSCAHGGRMGRGSEAHHAARKKITLPVSCLWPKQVLWAGSATTPGRHAASRSARRDSFAQGMWWHQPRRTWHWLLAVIEACLDSTAGNACPRQGQARACSRSTRRSSCELRQCSETCAQVAVTTRTHRRRRCSEEQADGAKMWAPRTPCHARQSHAAAALHALQAIPLQFEPRGIRRSPRAHFHGIEPGPGETLDGHVRPCERDRSACVAVAPRLHRAAYRGVDGWALEAGQSAQCGGAVGRGAGWHAA